MSDEKPRPVVVVPDELLAEVPPEDREKVRADIEATFQDFDPDDPPGEPVQALNSGVTQCPECGTTLVFLGRNIAGLDGGRVDFLDCGPCDRSYVTPTTLQ